MKTKATFAFAVTALLFSFLISGCDPEITYPDESYTGLNNFACYINGREWVAQNYRKSNKFRLLVGYDNAYPQLGLSIIANNHRKDRDQSLLFESAPLDTFPFDSFPRRVPILNGVYDDYLTDEQYATQTEGFFVEFTRFDTTLRIISGRFEFEASDEAGGSILVTDGIFDVTY